MWGIPLVTAAAAWGGSRQALNGTRERVREISADLKAHIAEEDKTTEELLQRVTAVETKIDLL